jgi:hypothetical protein
MNRAFPLHRHPGQSPPYVNPFLNRRPRGALLFQDAVTILLPNVRLLGPEAECRQ